MTPELAQEIAAELFDGHPAAAALLVESQHGETQERRRRSWLALLVIDPDQPLPDRWPDVPQDRRAAWRGTALEGPANAIADLVLVCFYCTHRETRRRAADLLASVCRKAAEIVRAAEANAA
jgi:hypothetical protein